MRYKKLKEKQQKQKWYLKNKPELLEKQRLYRISAHQRELDRKRRISKITKDFPYEEIKSSIRAGKGTDYLSREIQDEFWKALHKIIKEK